MSTGTDMDDRGAGVMVGLACGDALGAAYEFGGPYPAEMPVEMKGGGPFGWEPGEWTDDTSMAIPLLQLIASGAPPTGAALDGVVDAWLRWAQTSKDVGAQTSTVLSGARTSIRDERVGTATAAFTSAAEFQRRSPNAAGNGSLMRTAPIGLLGPDLSAVARPAAEQSRLTHPHRDAQIACALWSMAIAHAVSTGELDVRVGLRPDHIAATGIEDANNAVVHAVIRDWDERIEEAEANPPEHFRNNGWVVEAFQAAWSSIVHTGARANDDPDHLRRALEAAVRGGNDTDTVAAIAGGLVGAAYGATAVPEQWRRAIHGWPGWSAAELSAHAVRASRLIGCEAAAGAAEEVDEAHR